MTDTNAVGFAGLSHLGIVYSTATIARGLPVVAFDSREKLVKDLTEGKFPIREPGLEELWQAHRERIHYTADADAIARCGLILFALDVQTDENNNSDLKPLEALIESVAARAAEGTVLVMMSQVPPGFCRRLQGQLGRGLQLYYQVETLVFGNAVERAVHPERYMVGCSDPARPVPGVYDRFLRAFECPVLPMRYESAELCKIAINCFLVSSVTTANTLAGICEKSGADWSEIAPALRLDRRIGPHAYLKPGLGIAGGNLERDLVTVQNLAAAYGCDAGVVTAWQRNSAYCRDWALRRLAQLGLLADPNGAPLALWGLAYKPDTHSIKNSPSVALLRSLAGYSWQAHDPVAKVEGSEFPGVRLCDAPLEAARDARALVVMTPWSHFAKVPIESIRENMRGHEILDPYGALDGAKCRELGFRYHRLGAGPLC
jgi:UDPglucose 6-dehydrogenase